MNLSPTAFGALIGLVGVAAGILVRDVAAPFLAWLNRSSTARKEAVERYAQPFATSVETMFWRLDEMLVKRRFSYLIRENRIRAFQVYKFESSIYRIAALLGWIWALNEEHSLLLEKNSRKTDSFVSLAELIAAALADGMHVEEWKVQQLCELWRIDLPAEQALGAAGSDVEDILDAATFQAGSRKALTELDHQARFDLLAKVRARIERASPRASLNRADLLTSSASALEILGARQAWVFRDWQRAIGEVMTRRTTGNSARLFDVIGFAEFSSLREAKNPWLLHLEEVIGDVDFDSSAPDFRRSQLEKLHGAVARTLVRLQRLRLKQKCVSPNAAMAAKVTVQRYQQVIHA
ncbi:MAG TPA: hypothetical protein VGG29_06935 [Caulobacteraceae bacterium]